MILKKNNIAEYILYLWQIEDYLRAFPQQADANQELHDLSEMMHQENILEKGHLQLAQNALSELEDLHNDLLDQEATYRAAMIQLTPSLNLLKAKTDRPTMSDIEDRLVLQISSLISKKRFLACVSSKHLMLSIIQTKNLKNRTPAIRNC